VRLQNTQTAAARTAFRRAVRLNPDLMEGRMQLGPREAYGSLGIMHVRTDQWTRARRMFEQVLELDPQTTAARRLLKKLSP